MGSFERAFWYILAEATPKSEVRNLGERVQPKRTPYTLVIRGFTKTVRSLNCFCKSATSPNDAKREQHLASAEYI